ncbi:MAG: helix-turn-helix domain-containing protein [candidate division Zixibacteria bacterium]|nr:helix-turn-helix domain-containing protein [candidate division Zixibacteria bacterium]
MTYLVKNVYIDQPVQNENCTEQHILRTTIQYDQEIDFPFILGKTTSIFSKNPVGNNQGICKARIIEHLFVTETGFFKQVINIGEFGWYFVALPYGMIFKSLLYEPIDLDIDLYIRDNKNLYKNLKNHNNKIDPFERGLLFSFYNPTSISTISIKGQIIKDTRDIYSKLKANPIDLELREYYLKRCLAKAATTEPYTEPASNLMNMDEASTYLGISVSTLYNWISGDNFEVIKVGGKNKFRKSDLEQYLENQTKKPKTGRRRGKR